MNCKYSTSNGKLFYIQFITLQERKPLQNLSCDMLHNERSESLYDIYRQLLYGVVVRRE